MAFGNKTGQVFYGRHRTAYTLDAFIKKGGEGEVYGIKNYPEKVVKLYTDVKFQKTKYISDPRTFLKEKIETMLDYPVTTHLNGQLVITWPTDILYDSSGQFVGYVMPRVHAKKSLRTVFTDNSNRRALFPNYSWKTAVGIAYNLSQAVDLVHSKGYIIGDMNEMNFLINEKGHITVIDTDSFNIKNQKTGKVYKCSVGRNELMPPELQGRDRSRPTTVFTKESDNFGLAIHIFQLLMNGVHPFNAINARSTQSTPSTSNGSEMHNILNGICPYVTGGTGKPAAFAPDPKMMPFEIRSLFDRTFKYTAAEAATKATASKRAKASEWIDALYKLMNQKFIKCTKDSHHLYLSSYGKCPWCAIKGGLIPNVSIPVLPTGKSLTGGSAAVSPVKTGPVRRPVWTLSTACVGTGLVISPFLAQYAAPWIERISTWWLPYNYIMIGLAMIGGIIGYGISWAAEDQYVHAYNAVPWLLLALLPPLLAFGGVILLSGVCRLVWLLLLLLFEVLKWVLTIAVILVCVAMFV